MAGELILSEVATPSTPSSGKESLYFTNATPSRLSRVDSNGVVYPEQEFFIISLTADNTAPTNVNTAQAVFNTPSNGTVTLPASTSWEFDGCYFLTNTGTSSHTWGLLFGGGASLTSGSMFVTAVSTTSTAIAAVSQGVSTSLGSAYTSTAASTSATENVTFKIRGIVRINAGGTFIPQFQASAATGVAPVIKTNSFFRMTPFGSNSATSLGPWT
jgi:hypothetical protein